MNANAKNCLIVQLYQQSNIHSPLLPEDARGSFIIPYFCDATTWDDLHSGIEYRLNMYFVEHAPKQKASTSSHIVTDLPIRQSRNKQQQQKQSVGERKPSSSYPTSDLNQYRLALAGNDPCDNHMCCVCYPHGKPAASADAQGHSKISIVALKKVPSGFRSNVQTRLAQKRGITDATAPPPDLIPRSRELVGDNITAVACLFRLDKMIVGEQLVLKDHAEWQVSETTSMINVLVNGGRHVRRPVSGQATVGDFMKEICVICGAAGVRSIYHSSTSASLFCLERVGNIAGFSDVWVADLIIGNGSGRIEAREDVPLCSPAARKMRYEPSVPLRSQSTYNVINSLAPSNSSYSDESGQIALRGASNLWLDSISAVTRTDTEESEATRSLGSRRSLDGREIRPTQQLLPSWCPSDDGGTDDEEDEEGTEQYHDPIRYAPAPLFDSDDARSSSCSISSVDA